jgi:dihydrofolate reductase
MGQLSVFNFTTINGFYKGPGSDISWHHHGGEESEYSADALSADNILLFGRVTYDMMAGFWPTPMAAESAPAVAEGMNKAEKIVFSNTIQKADWNNTRVMSGNIIEQLRRMKQTSAKDMTILGSGSILTQFAEAGLIDTYQLMIDPVAIGSGIPIFNNIKQNIDLELISSKVFKSGTVLLTYRPLV